MVKKLSVLCAYVFALIFELLPSGVVLYFINPEGEDWRYTYSYFDPIPFGYADFGPLLTAVLTCILLVLTFILLFIKGERFVGAVRILGACAVATSLMPLMFGIKWFTPIGVVITVLLALAFGLGFVKAKE